MFRQIILSTLCLFLAYQQQLSSSEHKHGNLALEEIHSVMDIITSATHYVDLSSECDFFRHFIHINTNDIKDEENELHIQDTLEYLNRIVHYFYHGNPKPHGGCEPRVHGLAALLENRGIKTRVVTIITSKYDDLREHAILEVYNPEEERWELHDPVFDYHLFLSLDENYRLSTEEAVLLDLDFIGVGMWEGHSETWPDDHYYHTPHIQNYYEAMEVVENGALTYIINGKKFDLSKRFVNKENKTFLELIEGEKGAQVIIH